jgi:hypothetical protein
MPRAGKAQKPDASAVYIAWQGGSVDVDGVPVTWGQGERLRGDSLAVQHASWCFVPDGLPAHQWPSHHAGRPEQLERERRIAENPYDVRTLERPAVLDPALYVRCTKAVKVGYGPNVEGIPASFVTLEPGQILARSEPVVERRPDAFEDFKP